ncbi:MAG: nucleoside triphosphate pyrophosphohydrolase [Acidobacteriota bacterium]
MARSSTDPTSDSAPPASGRVDVDALLELIARLRAPDGCPWDRKQTLSSVRAYLIEEAHEVAAAIDAEDFDALREELGDLLFQVSFVGRLAEEAGVFQLADAADEVRQKMIERHPHVFGAPEERLDDAADVARAWERRKAAKRASGSILDGVPPSLPALVGAYRLTQKAAGVGFDWPDPADVLDKIQEEVGEVVAELDAEHPDPEAIRDEIGDLLLAVANLARHVGVDPEAALQRANGKFRRRFGELEALYRDELERTIDTSSAQEMDDYWEEVKRRRRARGDD